MATLTKTDILIGAALEYVHAADAIPDNIFDLSESERHPYIERHIHATYALKVAAEMYETLDKKQESDYSERTD